MAEQWTIEGPKVLDVGGADEEVTALDVTLVAGAIDVVTHDDSPTARVEVTEVVGSPLDVTWDGHRLKIAHIPTSHGLSALWEGRGEAAGGLLASLKATFGGLDKNTARLSVSVPVGARVDVKTVSATALVSGVHNTVAVKTVSGSLTLDDLTGRVDITTVSGEVDARQLAGPVSVNAVSGAVTVQSSDLPRADVKTVSGDITLDLVNPRATIRSNSVSGDVTVRAPYDGFDLSAKSVSGQVVAGGRSLGRRAPSGSLSEGDRGLRLSAKAVSGSITLLRATDRGTAGSVDGHGADGHSADGGSIDDQGGGFPVAPDPGGGAVGTDDTQGRQDLHGDGSW